MTELRVEDYVIPAADLGPENPLPFFREAEDVKWDLHPSIPEAERASLGWRVGRRVLPYRLQDGYSRAKKPTAIKSFVLENETLRATFLPDFGGRLVSLYHKGADRELADRNPVLQFANIGLRDAWFSGGIEWNTAVPGHWHLTCSPVFTARIEGPQGEPALRIYEWDRVRCFPWQIDFHLPPGSQFLFARVRLVNPHEAEIPMYWWTCMAVAEMPETRVLCPADKILTRYGVSQSLWLGDLQDQAEGDVSYPVNSRNARDFFYYVPDGERRWIAAVDGSGAGLIQTSTERLRGRKLFVWGMGSGGRRWQEFLAEPGRAYIEIQAGLAVSQYQCIPMPAGAHWTWTEAFGLLQIDPAKAHSADRREAVRTAGAALEEMLPRKKLETLDREFAEVMTKSAGEPLHTASGWGALERRRFAAEGKEDRIPAELAFDESSLGPDQQPWLALLSDGALPETDPAQDPGQWMIQPEWEALLRESVQGDHWLTWLHIGNMRLEAFDPQGAREAWERSLELRQSGWALRNLSILERREGHNEAAADLLQQAWECGPRIAPLAIEYARALAHSERYDELRAFAEALPEEIRSHERLQLLLAQVWLRDGELDKVEALFEREFANVREGELSLSDLWFALQERRVSAAESIPIDDELRARVRRDFPPPRNIDFRMKMD